MGLRLNDLCWMDSLFLRKLSSFPPEVFPASVGFMAKSGTGSEYGLLEFLIQRLCSLQWLLDCPGKWGEFILTAAEKATLQR